MKENKRYLLLCKDKPIANLGDTVIEQTEKTSRGWDKLLHKTKDQSGIIDILSPDWGNPDALFMQVYLIRDNCVFLRTQEGRRLRVEVDADSDVIALMQKSSVKSGYKHGSFIRCTFKYD